MVGIDTQVYNVISAQSVEDAVNSSILRLQNCTRGSYVNEVYTLLQVNSPNALQSFNPQANYHKTSPSPLGVGPMRLNLFFYLEFDEKNIRFNEKKVTTISKISKPFNTRRKLIRPLKTIQFFYQTIFH